MPADAWNQNERDRDRDRPFELFISYARERRAGLNNLLENLKPYVRTGLIRLWTDHDIAKGGEWRPELAEAMDRCDGAILILCPKFLVSDWCRERELPHFHARCRREPFPLLPVLARDCQWQDDEILSRYQILPTGAVPISRHKPQYEAYTIVAREIRDALLAFRARHGLARRAPALPETPDPTRSALDALLAELPGVTPRLFGRDAELARMDIQLGGGPGGVLLWVAPGGVGKSALTRQWLGSRGWPPGTRFVGHSFYSQGSRDQTVSARAFLLRALAALGEHPEPTAADTDLGRLLAECAAKAPTVLALDGLEPLQQASDDPKLNGRLKDQGLAALLKGLGRVPGQAVCLASSRLPIPDPLIASLPHFREIRLGVLPRPGSVALLEARGLAGTPAEFDTMAETGPRRRPGCGPRRGEALDPGRPPDPRDGLSSPRGRAAPPGGAPEAPSGPPRGGPRRTRPCRVGAARTRAVGPVAAARPGCRRAWSSRAGHGNAVACADEGGAPRPRRGASHYRCRAREARATAQERCRRKRARRYTPVRRAPSAAPKTCRDIHWPSVAFQPEIPRMMTASRCVLQRLRSALDGLYGKRIERVVLYGSRARGDARTDSDYDVAVFLNDMADRWTEIDRLVEIEDRLLDETGAVINALPFRAKSYDERTPLMHEIRREGLER